ncbi:MAG: hypothetical protein E6J74_28840 [Deltaproteobacteria bacterium]|nr:MAG: hypothetical protein E6J74_28840 [Deltaproteobacteria bacterium]
MFRLATFWALIVLAAVGTVWPKHGTAITAGRVAPDVAGENWINSKPLAMADLKGRVVLVEFWTYG